MDATVLLAHSHPGIRAWVRDALVRAGDVRLVVEATRGEDAWHLIQQVRWDAVLIAYSLSGAMDGLQVIESAQAADARAPIVFLGSPHHEGLLCRLWRAGVAGCIPEEAPPRTIVRAVRIAAAGRLLWTAGQIARAQRWWDDIGSRLKALTDRETEVLALVATGLSNRQVAEHLLVAENTIQTHMRHVLAKLAVRNRVEAAALLAKEMSVNQGCPADH